MINAFDDRDMSQTLCFLWMTMRALSPFHIRPTSCVRVAAMLVLAGGIGVWGAVLLAPTAGTPPPGLTAAPAVRGDTAPLAQWFGASATPIRVVVVGLIAAGERGAALLRVEGAAPVAYRVGQPIGQGVTLVRVERNAVVLDTGSAELRVLATEAQALGSPGLVRVPARDASGARVSSSAQRGATSPVK